MATVTETPTTLQGGGQFVELPNISWAQYVALSEAIGERPDPRLIYLDGSLEIEVTSRHHDWYAERLAQLVVEVASVCRIPWKDAGTATYQREKKEAAVEGDKTFYFGPHAAIMKGSVNIDRDTQPPPDLAIEVEISHSANRPVKVWGRLGVPEVWRFHPQRDKIGFWKRREDDSDEPIDRSLGLPVLMPADVRDQMKPAESLGSSDWFDPLREWARATVLPRLGEPT